MLSHRFTRWKELMVMWNCLRCDLWIFFGRPCPRFAKRSQLGKSAEVCVWLCPGQKKYTLMMLWHLFFIFYPSFRLKWFVLMDISCRRRLMASQNDNLVWLANAYQNVVCADDEQLESFQFSISFPQWKVKNDMFYNLSTSVSPTLPYKGGLKLTLSHFLLCSTYQLLVKKYKFKFFPWPNLKFICRSFLVWRFLCTPNFLERCADVSWLELFGYNYSSFFRSNWLANSGFHAGNWFKIIFYFYTICQFLCGCWSWQF